MAGNSANTAMNQDSRGAFLLGRMETTASMLVFQIDKNISPDLCWFILFVGIPLGIIVFVYFCANSYARKKRKEELQRICLEIGLTSYPNIDSIPINSRPDPLDFPLEYAPYWAGTRVIKGVVLHGKINSTEV